MESAKSHYTKDGHRWQDKLAWNVVSLRIVFLVLLLCMLQYS